MRDSNLDIQIPWIEQVPRDWKTVKLARVTRINTGDMDTIDSTDDGVYPFYVRSPIVRRAGRFTFNTDAVLMSGDGAGAGRIFHRVSGKFACHQRVYCIEFLEQVTKDFGFYYLSIFFPMQVDAGSAKSTVDSIRKPMLNGMPIVFPPVTEQRRITSYIDRKTSEIDGLIEKLRREVELLEQYRREISWNVLTTGLDSNTPMVDSGVDWIGHIPRSWSVIPVRRLFEIVKRIEPGFSSQVLSITQKGIIPKDLSSHFGQIAESYDAYQRVDVGDYAMNSMDLLTGWVDRSKYKGITSPDYRVFRLRPQAAADPRYFTHVLQMGYTRRIFFRFGQGVSNLGRWRLQPKVFMSMDFPLPPLAEQRAIADYIEFKYAEVDSTICGITQQIELLGKYRKQVINDAVTGKIRVGKVA